MSQQENKIQESVGKKALHPLFSVGSKIMLLVISTACISSLLIGGFFYKRIAKITIAAEKNKLTEETRYIVPLFNSAFHEFEKDVRFLSQTPPIEGIMRSVKNNGIDPVDGSTTELWKQRLESIFTSMIKTKPGYVQIRYVGIEDNGKELVRVNCLGDVVEVVSSERLQSKGEEPYFKDVVKLPEGALYYSVISLNRENGVVQKPFMPVIRTIVPVFDDSGKMFGMVIINASIEKILGDILKQFDIHTDLFVVNDEGNYIVYERGEYSSGFRFGDSGRSTSENNIVKTIMNSDFREETLFVPTDNERYIIHYQKLRFDSYKPERYIAVALVKPEGDLLAVSYETRQNALLLSVILMLVASICAAILSSLLTRPLKQTIYEMRSYALGKRQLDLPKHLRDEIGELARVFDDLIKSVDKARASEEQVLVRLRAIMDNMADGVVTTDGDGIIEGANTSFCEMFGYRSVELIGRSIGDIIPFLIDGECGKFLTCCRHIIERGAVGNRHEDVGIKKNGDHFAIEFSFNKIDLGDGRNLYSGIVRDITDRKKAEEEIVRSNSELERFAYIASHDLQEPLRMVTSFSELLEEEYGSKLDEDAHHYIETICDAGQRMHMLVADLLEYSRVGNIDSSEPVDCMTHTELALSNLQEVIEETGALVKYNDLPVINANPVRFVRLMQNLIGNAIKYRHSKRAPKIIVKAQDNGDEWLFSVVDNGIGMKEEYLEQIFVIFKRLHSKHEYKGTGIGLAVCKKIVEGMGGRIWVESNLGKGSTFYFTVLKRNINTKTVKGKNTESNEEAA